MGGYATVEFDIMMQLRRVWWQERAVLARDHLERASGEQYVSRRYYAYTEVEIMGTQACSCSPSSRISKISMDDVKTLIQSLIVSLSMLRRLKLRLCL